MSINTWSFSKVGPPLKWKLQQAIATTTLFTVCSRGFCRLLRRKTDRNRHGRPQFRSSRGLSRFLRQKTDPNPPWTTILSVLTASPPDWRFSQVSGDRCGGEEVHEERLGILDYRRLRFLGLWSLDRSSSSCVFEKSLEIGRSQSFSSRLKLLLHHRICYVLLPRLRAWPPRASCLKLKTPFSEPHLPLPTCLVRQYHHLRRVVFFLCHLGATSAASSSSFFMTSSPFTPSSSPPNQRTRLHGEGGRRSSTEEASRSRHQGGEGAIPIGGEEERIGVMCILISCVFAD
ncbi:hypothetical protein Bca4012_074263 [Brassica carinata]